MGSIHFPKLKQFSLEDNKLKELPADMCGHRPLLEVASLSNNELTRIGDSFANCQKLYLLTLENNPQLEDVHLEKFVNLTSLMQLYLAKTGLKISEDDPNPEYYAKSPLKRLNLGLNALNDPNIFRHVSIFPNLRILYLYGNKFDHLNNGNEIQKYLPKLQILDLTDNELLHERISVTNNDLVINYN